VGWVTGDGDGSGLSGRGAEAAVEAVVKGMGQLPASDVGLVAKSGRQGGVAWWIPELLMKTHEAGGEEPHPKRGAWL
jgi:hypothetical protein